VSADLETAVRRLLAQKAGEVDGFSSDVQRDAAVRRARRRQAMTLLVAAILVGGITLGGYQVFREVWRTPPSDVVSQPGSGGGNIPSEGAKGCWPDKSEIPCGPGVTPGVWYPYRLQTHCGVREAYFDGRWWVEDSGLAERSGNNAPPGWGNPDQLGHMRLVDSAEAEFSAEEGRLSARFTPAGSGFEPIDCL